MATKLTAARVRSITKPGLHSDGGTLFLNVAPGGSKAWIQRLTIDGRRHDIGLGSVTLVSLAEARDKAHANRKLARAGGDPLALKRKAKCPTFAEAAQATFEAKAPTLTSEKSRREWLNGLRAYAYPVLGDMRLDQIGQEDALRVLAPIWATKPETARKTRQRMTAVFLWGMAHRHCSANPAGETIRGALPAMPSVKSHHAALPHAEIADALATIGGASASPSVKGALRFLILTAVRSGEARGARWDEIDREAGVWTIPGSRMKTRAAHRVPLTDAALAVLDGMEPHKDGSGLIFPSPAKRGSEISARGLAKALADNGIEPERATVHGMRTSFRTWCADNDKPREIAEAALAHVVTGVEGSYQRSDMLERRRDLMAAWADYATAKPTGKVITPAAFRRA